MFCSAPCRVVWVGNLVRYSYCAVAGLRRLGESQENVDFIQGQGKVRGFCILSAEFLNPCSKSMKS